MLFLKNTEIYPKAASSVAPHPTSNSASWLIFIFVYFCYLLLLVLAYLPLRLSDVRTSFIYELKTLSVGFLLSWMLIFVCFYHPSHLYL